MSLWSVVEDPNWRHTEQSLPNLPLCYRADWAEALSGSQQQFFAICNAENQVKGGFALQIDRSRTLPGHRHLRVHQFGTGLETDALEAAILALKRRAEADSRVLRLRIRVFSLDHRADIAGLLGEHGFSRSRMTESYDYTLALDLSPSVESLFKSFAPAVRQRIRKAEKLGFRVRVLDQPHYAGRLIELQQESMERSGGTFRLQDWPAILDLSRRHPGLSRIAGLFLPAEEGASDRLAGFAWACNHGTYSEYRAAGTTRKGLDVPVSHSLVWDLIQWAKQQQNQWFDLGGVPPPQDGDGPLAGVTQFKRGFSQDLRHVAQEWVIEPHPARLRLAESLGRGAVHLKTFARQWRERSHGS